MSTPVSSSPTRTTPWFRALASAVATVTGNLTLVIATLVCGGAVTLAGRVPPRGRWAYVFMRIWARWVLWGSFVRVRASRETELDPERIYVFMANHQSLYDIAVLLATLPGRPRFLAKRSLFRIPIFGWGMAAVGFVPVDRGDRSTARATFAAARKCLGEGHSIVIFPEETRSPGGLLPFKPGGFLLALKSRRPIVPIGIRGTYAVRPRAGFRIRPGTVEIHYGAPIDVASYGVIEKGALVAAVRERIAELAGIAAE